MLYSAHWFFDSHESFELCFFETVFCLRKNLKECNDVFQNSLKVALQDGSFEKLTEQDLNGAVNVRSVMGLDVVLPNEKEIETILFVRGRRLSTVHSFFHFGSTFAS